MEYYTDFILRGNLLAGRTGIWMIPDTVENHHAQEGSREQRASYESGWYQFLEGHYVNYLNRDLIPLCRTSDIVEGIVLGVKVMKTASLSGEYHGGTTSRDVECGNVDPE